MKAAIYTAARTHEVKLCEKLHAPPPPSLMAPERINHHGTLATHLSRGPRATPPRFPALWVGSWNKNTENALVALKKHPPQTTKNPKKSAPAAASLHGFAWVCMGLHGLHEFAWLKVK